MNDGGPAFPASISVGSRGDFYTSCETQSGMTMRDYFAAHAMAAIMVSDETRKDASKNLSKCAAWAYQQADAMIAERVTEKRSYIDSEKPSPHDITYGG
jgi:hypothetical protein